MSLQDDAIHFKAPECKIGDPVIFYTGGDKSQHPSIGFCIRTDGRSIDISTFDRTGHRVYSEVHHLTDPVLKINENIRKAGAWEINERMSAAANVHGLLKKFEERFMEVARNLQRQMDAICKEFGLKQEHLRVEDVPPVQTGEEESPADAGLKRVKFGAPAR